MQTLREGLGRKPIIAGLKGIKEARLTGEAGVKVCFYLTGDIFELRSLAKFCKEQGQMLFAHGLIARIVKAVQAWKCCG